VVLNTPLRLKVGYKWAARYGTTVLLSPGIASWTPWIVPNYVVFGNRCICCTR